MVHGTCNGMHSWCMVHNILFQPYQLEIPCGSQCYPGAGLRVPWNNFMRTEISGDILSFQKKSKGPMIITWFFLSKYDAPVYNLGVAYYTVNVKCLMWFRKWPNTLSSDMMAKELDFWNCKLALLPAVRRRRKTSFTSFWCCSMDLLATMMSSRKTKTKGSLASTQSSIRWKVLPAFLRPKGGRRNTKRPNGVMSMANHWCSQIRS